MKPNQFLFILGLSALAIAVGMAPAMVPAALAVADSSSQSPPGQDAMQSPSSDMQSMHPRSTEKEGMKPQSQGDVPIHISSITVRKIQEQLSQKGFKVGTADGMWGTSTSSGIKEFQKSQGLAPTGKLDIETIQSLNIQDIQSSESGGHAMTEQKMHQTAQSGAQVFISPSQLKSIQQSLKDQGYDPGQADGVWGSKTQAAISAYQQDKGMESTGFISIGMLENMGMSQEVAALGIGSSDMKQQAAIRQPGEKQARGYFGGEGEQSSGAAGQVQGSGAPLYAGSDLIRQVQQALKDAGEDPGEIDGKWNAQTQKALERFEESQNMTPTGALTIGTIQKLVGSGGFNPDTGGQPSSQPMTQPMQDSGQEQQHKRMQGGQGDVPGEKQEMEGSHQPGTQKRY